MKKSSIPTLYIYHRIYDILDNPNTETSIYMLSRLLDELALNYKADTGRLIGEINHLN